MQKETDNKDIKGKLKGEEKKTNNFNEVSAKDICV